MHEPGSWDRKIEAFVDSLTVGRGLDERTVKAYRLDLEHLYRWLKERGTETLDEDLAEGYLRYLLQEKKLRASTVTRKYRVFKGYLAYLSKQGFLKPHRELVLPVLPETRRRGEERAWGETAGKSEEEAAGRSKEEAAGRSKEETAGKSEEEAAEKGEERRWREQSERRLTRAEVDLFFIALDREYGALDSDFRKRVCLRDNVMMGLLFYHGLDISEILRLELDDYDVNTGVLSIRRKQDKRRGGDREKEWGQDRSQEHSRGDPADRIPIFSKELKERMELWIREHDHFEREIEYRDVLFLSKLGKPLSMKMVINIFDKYRILAGIEKACTPKDLKRSMERYARELMMERCS